MLDQTLLAYICKKFKNMLVKFEKYHGTGNDFIMIDNRDNHFPKQNQVLIAQWCTRRFGIGADGLILLENHPESKIDFKMVYFNADGRESTMCGNGGRCILAFAHSKGIFKEKTIFEAIDGLHEGTVNEEAISIKMKDVDEIEAISKTEFFLDTGSPHIVKIVDCFPENFTEKALAIRNNDRFKAAGVNVNYIIPNGLNLRMRTFERGVEDETFSCGTGAVAAAVCNAFLNNGLTTKISTLGGTLKVELVNNNHTFSNIWLTGSAVKVFDGSFRVF